MDKIAIISDIHGNITALNAVLEDIKNRKINKIFCLGDCITKCTHPVNQAQKVKIFGQEIVLEKNVPNLCHLFQSHMNFI